MSEGIGRPPPRRVDRARRAVHRRKGKCRVFGAGESVEATGTLDLSNLPQAAGGLTGVYVQLDATNVLAEVNVNNNLVAVDGNLGGSVENQPTEEVRVYLLMVRR